MTAAPGRCWFTSGEPEQYQVQQQGGRGRAEERVYPVNNANMAGGGVDEVEDHSDQGARKDLLSGAAVVTTRGNQRRRQQDHGEDGKRARHPTSTVYFAN